MKALPYLLRKEFIEMIRSIVLPVIFIVLPVVMINLIPRIATQEVRNLHFIVIDNDHSQASRQLIQKIEASTYFILCGYSQNMDEALQKMNSGNVDFIIELRPGFERDIIRDGHSDVGISANAVNGIKAGLGQSYLSQIIMQYANDMNSEMGITVTASPEIDSVLRPRFMFNPSLSYKPYMVPGIIALLLILLVGFLPALNIVGERQSGTIEQINVSPVGKVEFILSKLIPYWIVGIIILFISMLAARLIHNVEPVGNLNTILIFTSVFILVVSSLGLVISNYSTTPRQAALLMFFLLVIFIVMSGLLTPVESMPEWAQTITFANPLRHYIFAMRSIYLKGGAICDLQQSLYWLSLFAIIGAIWAVVSFRKQN